MKRILGTSTTVLFLSLSCGALAQSETSNTQSEWFEKNNASTQNAGDDLNAAHEAFIARDFDRMALLLRNALLKSANDPAFVENASSLMHRAYSESASHRINPDWHLNDGIEALKIGQLRRESPDTGTRFILRASGALVVRDSVAQFVVKYVGGDTVLDKANNIGEWSEGDDGSKWYNLGNGRRNVPFPDGLYTLSIRMKTGAATEGWFILHDSVSATVPTIQAPIYRAVVTTGNPVLTWETFRSSAYQSFERRNLAVAIRADDEVGTEKWTFDGPNPDVTSTTVGRDTNGNGVGTLEDGDYTVTLVYRESRKFGDMLLRREAASRVPFSVRMNK